MQPEEFQKTFGVSRETFEKLEIYHTLLFKWQKAINLVGDKTLQEAWERHFADSSQIAEYISENAKTIVDLGSGAGFPGLVLVVMRPELEVHLIESDERKVQFLRTVSRETETSVIVHDQRIEDVAENLKPDVVTARALAPLDQLLKYCEGWAKKNPALLMLFLKGREAQQEIEQARRLFNFDLQIHQSQTSPEGRILEIKALARCA